MKVFVKKFQDGGAVAPETEGQGVPQEGAAPEQQGGQEDPLMQIAQMAAQALQSQDCQTAMQVCEAFMQIVQQAQGGAPQEEAPQGEPVYRRGGTLVKRIKK
jgi:hypothetical protein